MKRRTFSSILSSAAIQIGFTPFSPSLKGAPDPVSNFAKRLEPIGRRLETADYYVWGGSPIADENGKVHLFYSRWPKKFGMGGWIHQSEIAHAIADHPEGEYIYQSTVLKPRGGNSWDATTCHNPHVKKVDGKCCLFYLGNSNKKTNTKRIGLATAESLDGPWQRPDHPLLDASKDPEAWDDHCTTNPSFVKHPNGEHWLYYKSWNTSEYENFTNPKIRGNRKYGLAKAANITGPYKKYKGNPVIDYSGKGNNIQAEDGFVWYEEGVFKMLLRDMGFYNHQYGLYLESKDGIQWSEPKIAYYNTDHYFSQPPKPSHLSKYGRFERPQILFKDDKPSHLFLTTQGGKHQTSSTFLFRINPV